MSPGAPQEGAAAREPPRRAFEFAHALCARFPANWATDVGSTNRVLINAIAFAFEEVTREDDELLTLLGRMVYAFSGWGNDEDAARLKELIAKRISP